MFLNSFKLLVSVNEAGERLDRYLAKQAMDVDSPLAGFSRSRLQDLIDNGNILVNNVVARASKKLHGNESINIQIPPPTDPHVQPEDIALDILFEDRDLIIINKPAGMAVHPGAGQQHGTLVAGLLAHCKDLSGIGGVIRPGIVHRLDKNTSGVLVVAKNDQTHIAVAKQFSARSVEKLYIAFVIGTPQPVVATIHTLYGRHPIHRQRFTAKVKSGKEAITSYRTVASHGGISQLAIKLGTGRTHQIRVHLSERGYPIVGDATYGGRCFNKVAIKLRELATQLDRHALHAAILSFMHPTTGKQLRFEAPLPADLVALVEAMR
ncbi:MAG: RluA family pseudouridine synthase [Deltaproteobacteria bacterium]|nr:RluA family pseudouridine synthase [Deltaproteobacteria bacterium]